MMMMEGDFGDPAPKNPLFRPLCWGPLNNYFVHSYSLWQSLLMVFTGKRCLKTYSPHMRKKGCHVDISQDLSPVSKTCRM